MSLTVRRSYQKNRFYLLMVIENFFFVGADDVIAFKPNSTLITIKNVTSYGTTGLSFGSIGQYPGVTDIIEDIWIEDVKFYNSPQSPGSRGIQMKSWVGSVYTLLMMLFDGPGTDTV